jgi:hypothetical protein
MSKIETTNWKRLIGKWNTEGRILTNQNDLESKITGTDSYEFILNGNFILHKADVLMGNVRSETYEIIALENPNEKVKMQYFNSEGENGIMFGFLNGNVFRIESENLKFAGTISNDSTIIGTWQQLSEENMWHDFLEMKLSK